jgi:hypothetical protein
MQIIPHKCIYIHYTSLEDWKNERDIARCNPSFHGCPRYDCIIVNTNPVSYARLLFVFSCVLRSGQIIDMAVVQWLKEAKWKPKTHWKNCQVFEENGRSIIFLKYVVRACHMIPTFDGPDKSYYLNDMVDGDMFWHCGGLHNI